MSRSLSCFLVAVLAGTCVGQPTDDAASRAEVARARIAALQAELDAAQAQLAEAEAAVAAEGFPEEAYTPGWLEGWKGSVEAGVNGSDGNTEQLSFRVAATAVRTTEQTETTLATGYKYGSSNGVKNESRFEASIRNDWLLKDSRWRYFAQGKFEYDEFQDWDYRLSAFGGVGYEFITNEKTTLVGRVGLGGSYEIGGMDEDFKPEGLLGLDFSHQLTANQKLKASTEFYPDLSDTSEFRMINRAGWEIMVDPETNMFLRVGAEHRHDSDPGAGFKNNDLDYYLTLGWNF